MTDFPPIEAFTSVLSGPISEEDYQHGLDVYKTFECDNMKVYLELYNRLDTLLIAEALAVYREFGMQQFKLNMLQYLSLPMYSLDCMLRYTQTNIELLSDIDQILFIEKGIRGLRS